eukprot:3089241-Pleurochrysis_carterae.AAC.1
MLTLPAAAGDVPPKPDLVRTTDVLARSFVISWRMPSAVVAGANTSAALITYEVEWARGECAAAGDGGDVGGDGRSSGGSVGVGGGGGGAAGEDGGGGNGAGWGDSAVSRPCSGRSTLNGASGSCVDECSSTFEDLVPASYYTFQISARNIYGSSPLSDAISLRTSATIPDRVTHVHVIAITTTSLALGWHT